MSEKLFKKAVELGTKRYEQSADSLSLCEKIQDRALETLVRKKVAGRFGGRLKAFVSGGAPLNYDIGVFFLSLGVRLLQGYGQTETAPVVSANPPRKIKIDTVGPVFPGVELKIAEDGEILIRGELTMDGYWNAPDLTAEALRDSWVHTGDIGELDEDGYIKITDRKKDIIVNSGGDNVSPQRVEVLVFEPELSQAMVYGDKRLHLVAVLVPDDAFIAQWARENDRKPDLGELSDPGKFHECLRETMERAKCQAVAHRTGTAIHCGGRGLHHGKRVDDPVIENSPSRDLQNLMVSASKRFMDVSAASLRRGTPGTTPQNAGCLHRWARAARSPDRAGWLQCWHRSQAHHPAAWAGSRSRPSPKASSIRPIKRISGSDLLLPRL